MIRSYLHKYALNNRTDYEVVTSILSMKVDLARNDIQLLLYDFGIGAFFPFRLLFWTWFCAKSG